MAAFGQASAHSEACRRVSRRAMLFAPLASPFPSPSLLTLFPALSLFPPARSLFFKTGIMAQSDDLTLTEPSLRESGAGGPTLRGVRIGDVRIGDMIKQSFIIKGCTPTSIDDHPGTQAAPHFCEEVIVRIPGTGFPLKEFRLDFVFPTPTHFVIVECDEHQHTKRSYTPMEEFERMRVVTHTLLAGNKQMQGVIWVRFNPHKFTVPDAEGGRFTVGYSTPGVSLETRFEVLWAHIKKYLGPVWEGLLSRNGAAEGKTSMFVKYLYYDMDYSEERGKLWPSVAGGGAGGGEGGGGEKRVLAPPAPADEGGARKKAATGEPAGSGAPAPMEEAADTVLP